MNTRTAVHTEGLGRSFNGTPAVAGLSLQISHGEIFGLIGPDGAGKTTTLRMLTALLDPDAGDAFVLGRHTVREAEALKPQIGYMSQRFGLYPDLTVQENLDFFADLHDVPAAGRRERLDRLLAFGNLTPYRRRQAGNLSGGMKQKLGLACALVHTPRVLFLDEPTNGVDPLSRREFWRILYQLQQEGVTIVVTTAYLDEADRCHRVGLLHQGRLLACDTPDGLRALLPGTLLELRCDQPRQAARRLRAELPGVSVTLFGDRIHLVCAEPPATIAAVRSLLADAAIAVSGFQPLDASLEDVFIAAVGGERGGDDRE